MSAKRVIFESEETRSRQEVAGFLRELADRVERGEVVLRQGAEEVTLALPERLVLEVKAEEKTKPSKTKRSLEIELEWGEGGEGGVSLG